ncbi:hypothetical protein CR513_07752, partial [Mucuna pruriens]
SLDVINIGPAFRGHYGAFSPNSKLPALDCGLRGSPMIDDADEERLGRMKQAAKDQRELDGCAEGFDVGRLSRMMGSEARSYTEGVEELYQKMLVKVETLTSLVEKSSAKLWNLVEPVLRILPKFKVIHELIGGRQYGPAIVDDVFYFLMPLQAEDGRNCAEQWNDVVLCGPSQYKNDLMFFSQHPVAYIRFMLNI